MLRWGRLVVVLSMLMVANRAFGVGTPSFRGLGHLVVDTTTQAGQALAVSADGKVVVGMSGLSNGFGAFRWTEAEGMTYLGDLPGGTIQSVAQGVSADGSVIVGYSASSTARDAFRWTAAEGMTALAQPILDGLPATFIEATDVSADGRIIVGYAERNGVLPRAVRWVDGVPQLFAPLFSYSQAYGISDDGEVIVGQARMATGVTMAFRWTEATGLVSLGNPPSGDPTSIAYEACGNGETVVGIANSGNRLLFRWTEGEGMTDIGGLPDGTAGLALDCTPNGRAIVGEAVAPGPRRAMIWGEYQGMRDLQQVLVSLGVQDAVSWSEMTARGISADGTVIVGNGRRADGRRESWMAVIVPEPTGLEIGLLGTAGLLLTAVAKRFSRCRRC